MKNLNIWEYQQRLKQELSMYSIIQNIWLKFDINEDNRQKFYITVFYNYQSIDNNFSIDFDKKTTLIEIEKALIYELKKRISYKSVETKTTIENIKF